ncbi:hypothetical protein M422DRAFT_38868 [Sphaerobolus stellatus SS14]|uniref:BTB domain-containing protein n=1 Tax=Sphaerobolus stellatus (strain SS14) TaxID=990650 RepID=A0A0C9UJ24_SPHS4|nr:hypothetical protein M422DRAFT_38868 [Sphaerobolus stellatus SS14]
MTEGNSCLPSGKSSEPVPCKDEQYYFEDGTVFLVNGWLFRIPRMMLQLESEVFRGMFTMPAGHGELQTVEGIRDNNPISLPDVSDTDFRRLLAYLYPMTTDYTNFTVSWGHEAWMSILRVSDRFMMENIKQKAIASINKLDDFPTPVERIHNGTKYHLPWVRQGYKQLVIRPMPLTAEEGHALGMETTVRVAEARERFVRERNRLSGPQRSSTSPSVYEWPGSSGYYPDGPSSRFAPQRSWTRPASTPHNLKDSLEAVEIILDEVFGNTIPQRPAGTAPLNVASRYPQERVVFANYDDEDDY